jgi:ABC-type dipeptide/oligopeptide/nickel transport system permease subunit
MKSRRIATAVLAAASLAVVGADVLAPESYSHQDRLTANASPSPRSPLGRDELGRDRFSRLLFATRMSLGCAAAAALAATAGAALAGVAAGFGPRLIDEGLSGGIDLFLSVPWLFLLLTLRSLLPLNAPPWSSALLTFALLAGTGWPFGARVIRARVRDLRRSPWIVHARACGCREDRLLVRHVLPSLRPALVAQYWTLVPIFILAEANLSVLGLGFAEPLPSWGGLLGELRRVHRVAEAPWLLAPAVLMVAVVASLHTVLSEKTRG